MKHNLNAITLLCVLVLSNCKSKIEHSNANQFRGVWSLYIIEQIDPVSGTWKEWKDGAQGSILYDDETNMAVHLTAKGHEYAKFSFPFFIDTLSYESLRY